MTEDENLIGALAFFAYILAALFLTGLIVRDLGVNYGRSHDVKHNRDRSVLEASRRRDKAQVFAALCVVSFATLSYHMLAFLIDSHRAWIVRERISSPNLSLGTFNPATAVGREGLARIWRWSTHSTLFQAFAEVICDDPRRFWWTQQALIYSFAWSLFMSIEGVRYNIPHLWAYFVLNQILPSSFGQNLFCTAVFLTPSVPQSDGLVVARPWLQTNIAAGYLLTLSAAQSSINTSTFFIVLFGARLLLFAPYLVLRPTRKPVIRVAQPDPVRLYMRYAYAIGVTMVGALVLQYRQTKTALPLGQMTRAIGDDHAISAIGYDYLIGVTSVLVFSLINRP